MSNPFVIVAAKAAVAAAKAVWRMGRRHPCMTCGSVTTNRENCDGCDAIVTQRKKDAEARHAESLLRAIREREMEQQRKFAENARDRTHWLSLSARDFELQVGTLYETLGYTARVTPAAHDHGIDVHLEKDGHRYVVQCKHFTKGSVARPDLQQFYGALMHEGAAGGMFVTTSRFTQTARAFVGGKPIELVDLDALVALGQVARGSVCNKLDAPHESSAYGSSSVDGQEARAVMRGDTSRGPVDSIAPLRSAARSAPSHTVSKSGNKDSAVEATT